MKATPIPTDVERLVALATWFDHAARWFEREVQDSRANLPTDGDDTPAEHRVEVVTFLTGELDAMVGGFRRASDMLLALTDPLPGPILTGTAPPSTTAPKRPRDHLRVVK